MTATVLPPPIPAPERLARVIEAMLAALYRHGVRGRMTGPLLVVVWGRLSRMLARIRRLAAKIAAGAPLTPRPRPAVPRPGGKPPPRLPRSAAWIIVLVPGTAACAVHLRSLLTDPEMAALATLPQMRRLLNPLCRMLDVEMPPLPRPAATPPKLETPAPPPPPPPMRPDPVCQPAIPPPAPVPIAGPSPVAA